MENSSTLQGPSISLLVARKQRWLILELLHCRHHKKETETCGGPEGTIFLQ
jgi:hypothetical protein